MISALGLPERLPAQARDRGPARLRDHADDPAAGGSARGLDRAGSPSRAGVAKGKGDGFWSGTAVGASLGLVYAPCAGPILAGVITVSASQSFNAGRLAVALAYGLGSAVVLYFLMLGGRRLVAPLARRGVGLQVAIGAVMVVVALAMLGDYDIRFQNTIASRPADPSSSTRAKSLENTASAQVGARDHPRRHGHDGSAPTGATAAAPATPPPAACTAAYYGPAPEFVDNQRWFNTPGGRPLTLKRLRGRVVLVDFWTYSCINCIRTLPYLKAWDKRYRKDGLTIVGVHTPEFPFEREAEQRRSGDRRPTGSTIPWSRTTNTATWNAYGNQYWPAEYFIDAQGHVRYAHFGEGEYGEKEKVIRELLAEAGGRRWAAGGSTSTAIAPSADGRRTPETYLGAARAERFTNPILSPGLHDFSAPPRPADNEFAYRGSGGSPSTRRPPDGRLARPQLRRPPRLPRARLARPQPRRVRVLLDGKPISGADAGSDVHGGAVTVDCPAPLQPGRPAAGRATTSSAANPKRG